MVDWAEDSRKWGEEGALLVSQGAERGKLRRKREGGERGSLEGQPSVLKVPE